MDISFLLYFLLASAGSGNSDYTIIDCGTIKSGTRYEFNNPFPNRAIECKIEIYHKNEWAYPGHATWINGSAGVWCEPIGNKIIVRSAQSIKTHSAFSGSPFMPETYDEVYSAPARIKVWTID